MPTSATRNKERNNERLSGINLLHSVQGPILNQVNKVPDYSGLKEGEVLVYIDIGSMNYVWAGKKGSNHPEIVAWYNQFEDLLREENFGTIPTSHTQHGRRMLGYLWNSVKNVYMDVKQEMQTKGSSCIMDGIRDPLRVILMPDGTYLPRMGNQRLCILRARDFGNPPCTCHDGKVPVVVLTK